MKKAVQLAAIVATNPAVQKAAIQTATNLMNKVNEPRMTVPLPSHRTGLLPSNHILEDNGMYVTPDGEFEIKGYSSTNGYAENIQAILKFFKKHGMKEPRLHVLSLPEKEYREYDNERSNLKGLIVPYRTYEDETVYYTLHNKMRIPNVYMAHMPGDRVPSTCRIRVESYTTPEQVYKAPLAFNIPDDSIEAIYNLYRILLMFEEYSDIKEPSIHSKDIDEILADYIPTELEQINELIKESKVPMIVKQIGRDFIYTLL